MLKIEVKDGNIEKALKIFKFKTNKIKQNQILRENQEYKKPSIIKREILKKAKYIQQKNTGTGQD